ncbi:hypothetical protein [Natrarchaeobius chitinivorans]|uniref:Uncharacterized protein n=1 Tax=Natrarchaeobius chitinivorans TaxID=1679083 RepID=A0A3N6PI85_NATCH|nr:hypothetical protein [Natrarchaeobius chitinivorans]RQG97935.1 hypothetical protein EA473_01715 [Natrarchaeobius chitinivorans]
MTLGRREVLQLAGTTAIAGTLGLAGCTTADARSMLEDDDLPVYSRWLTLENGGLEFTHVDWTSLEGYVEDELEEVQPTDEEAVPAEYEADPMIVLPSEGLLSAYFFVGLTLAPYGLGRILEDDLESTVEGLLSTNEAFVVTGPIEPAEIDDRLTDEPDSEFFRQFERTDEIGDYDVYTPVDDDDVAIAVGTDALVVAMGDGEDDDVDAADPTTVLQTTIATGADGVDRATDDEESLEWLVGTASGDVSVGQYGDRVDIDAEFEGLDGTDGFVSSLSVEDAETSTGEFAAIIDDPDERTLEGVLGASADERSIDVDDDRVTATATWREVS